MALYLQYEHGHDQATHAEVLAWCAWYRADGHAGQSSLVRRFAAVKHYFNWLIERGARADNPCDGIHLKHPSAPAKEPFSEEELRRILAACNPSRPHERAIVLLLVDTGLRLNEVSSLRPENIDLERRTLRVIGKGEKHRVLAFGERTAEALSQCLRGGSRFLWRSQRSGVAMKRDGIYRLLRRLGKRTGIRVHAHRFRTTFAVLFDKRTKGDVGSLQILMGHSKITTTLQYIAWGRLERALDRQREIRLADAL